MVDMKATNNKLFDRAVRLVMETTKVSYDKALEVLKECDFHVKLAIVMIQRECNIEEAKELLDSANGYIAHALDL